MIIVIQAVSLQSNDMSLTPADDVSKGGFLAYTEAKSQFYCNFGRKGQETFCHGRRIVGILNQRPQRYCCH